MKKTSIFISLLGLVFILAACQSKNIKLLSKKWDYAKIDNVDSVDKKFMDPDDSVNNAYLEQAKKLLSWTFYKDNTYKCMVGKKVATAGTYELTDNDKYLEMTPESKMATTTYSIKALTENELILMSSVNNVSVTMYFTADN